MFHGLSSDTASLAPVKSFVGYPYRHCGNDSLPLILTVQRKISAPDLTVHSAVPELPPRSKKSAVLTGSSSKSQDNLQDAYAVVDLSPSKKDYKKHKRNRSADLQIRRDLCVESEGQSNEVPAQPNGKRGFNKSHPRMKSHEIVSTLQSQENGILGSGKSSAESSHGESASVLRESQSSPGKYSLISKLTEEKLLLVILFLFNLFYT